MEIRVRVPSWADRDATTVDGEPAERFIVSRGESRFVIRRWGVRWR